MKTMMNYDVEIDAIKADIEWIKGELARIHRDRPRPEDQSPYDLNRHQLKPIKRVKINP